MMMLVVGLLVAGNGMAHADSLDAPRITEFRVAKPVTGDVDHNGNYHAVQVPNEWRVYYRGRHFASVLIEDGIFAIRPHPGMDVDGWGSTLYLQPFFDDALNNQTDSVTVEVETDCVRVEAEGSVAAVGGAAGTWQVEFKLTSSDKSLSATGDYCIQLAGALPEGKDLKLYKLASNFLQDVPLLGGGMGDTGDMMFVRYGDANIWKPNAEAGEQVGHFPPDVYSSLVVECSGATNEVDTVRQGHVAIKLAYKPSLKVTLESPNTDKIRFGGIFKNDQDFASDNIGITPWMKDDDLTPGANYSFALSIESEAVPGDQLMDEVSFVVEDESGAPWLGIFYSPTLTGDYFRMGSVRADAPGVYKGILKSPDPGFFKARNE